MTIRLRSILMLVLFLGAAYGLYLVKWEVRELKRQNAALMAQIEHEKQATEVLQAEWAYLSRPERLRKLAKLHLGLNASGGHQFAEINQLPLKGYDAIQPGDGLVPGTMFSSAKGY